jgi:beta-lactamase class A
LHDNSRVGTAVVPPPVLSAPAAREVSFGRIAGIAPRGTRRVVVRVGRAVVAERRIGGRSFDFTVDLPPRDATVRVTAVGPRGTSSTTVAEVYGLPRASRPRVARAPVEDAALARAVRSLARGFGRTAAVWVEDPATGRAAAWNAGARFPAASTLKLAIAVEALRTWGVVAPGARALLHRMIVDSDNAAANDVEVLLAGSTSAGSARVNALMRALGLTSTEMYGGYERTPSARGRPVPVRVDDQGWGGRGKFTTAHDLGRLAAYVHLAAAGRGPLARRGFTGADARYLLWLLAHVRDRGKLDRFLHGARVLHKAGWIGTARHDNGLVYWAGGVAVVTVMTYRPAGAGTSSDVLAGRVAAAALAHLRTKER